MYFGTFSPNSSINQDEYNGYTSTYNQYVLKKRLTIAKNQYMQAQKDAESKMASKKQSLIGKND